MGSTSVLSSWKRYKRYADNVKVEGRLVQVGERKMIEIQEPGGPEFCCPHCKEVLTQVGGNGLPNFLLDPKIFHARHKPIDND